MLALVKTALRISTTAFDDELQLLIAACLEEMAGLNVIIATDLSGKPESTQVQSAVIAYCKWQFGNHEDKEAWADIYHQKLAQLKTMTNYTDWGNI